METVTSALNHLLAFALAVGLGTAAQWFCSNEQRIYAAARRALRTVLSTK